MNNTVAMMALHRTVTQALAGMLAVIKAHAVDSIKKAIINQRAQFAPRRSFQALNEATMEPKAVCATITGKDISGLTFR